jgi:hypothetical protein
MNIAVKCRCGLSASWTALESSYEPYILSRALEWYYTHTCAEPVIVGTLPGGFAVAKEKDAV